MPRGLIHSDVHLKNWYVCQDGEMGINDWQNSSRGNGSRDLAYAISTGLSIEKRRLWERELLQYYVDRLALSGGPKVPFADVFLRYRQQLFAALAWWTGTLGQPPEAPKMQPPEVSREFIRRMAAAIDDLDALDSF
jgi:aminoglycoside phosphotransferase (APT) family kinase protein